MLLCLLHFVTFPFTPDPTILLVRDLLLSPAAG